MLYQDFVREYSTETDDETKGVVLEHALEFVTEEDNRKEQELLAFIDDFVASDEYQHYLRAKQLIHKNDVGTQYNQSDIVVEYKTDNQVERYPLTEETKKMFAFKQQFENYLESEKNLETLQKQQRGIEIIKQKIAEARRIFECTKEDREKNKDRKDQTLLEKYSIQLKVDLTKFSSKSQKAILDKIRTNRKELYLLKNKRRNNILKIISKLVFEYTAKQRALEMEKRRRNYKVRKMERVIEDMEVVGTKMTLFDKEAKQTDTLEIDAVEDTVEAEEVIPERQEKKKATKKDKGEKKGKTEKKEKPAKEKKTKEKGGKKKDKDKTAQLNFELPSVPIVNPREKITAKNLDDMVDLIEQFRNFDGLLEDKSFRGKEDMEYTNDVNLVSKPTTIVFRNYEAGRSYKKVVVVMNTSTDVKKCRFLRFKFPYEYDELAFDVEFFGIAKLFTGRFLRFSISFQPFNDFKGYEGFLVLLSYNSRACRYFQFEIPLACLPISSNLKIYPDVVCFGSVPIWRANSYELAKILKVSNAGTKSCTVYIHKIKDPLELGSIFDEENKENIAPTSSSSSSNETNEDVNYILNLCLENLENNFYFEDSFFTLSVDEDKKIKVYLKDVHYVGDYFEKYSVDVYENSENSKLEIVGCRELSLFAEVTGYFIKLNPEVVDFEICVYNACYQKNFEVINDSSHTQAITIKFPSQIADLVQSDVNFFYLPPQGTRRVWIKFTPRKYISKQPISYYDRNTSILEFPVYVSVVSKNYQNCPPSKVTVYALLTDCADLSITVRTAKHLSNFMETALLDLGVCSVYETITADIEIVNNSLVTQVCGFLNLPEFVTVTPNYGFIKILPGDRKAVMLFISPEFKDFPDYPEDNMSSSDVYFKLGLECVGNVGKLKTEINAKRLISSAELLIRELSRKQTVLTQEVLNCAASIKEHFNTTFFASSLILRADQHGYATSLGNRETSIPTYNIPREPTDLFNNLSGSILDNHNFVILETSSRKEIWCKVLFIKPLLELSHQYVEFPDTPCGSYSVMEVCLSASGKKSEGDCGNLRKYLKPNKLNYTAKFTITGSTNEITIEPKCGVLKAGESIKIILLAKPNVPDDIVQKTAKSLKYSEIYERKLQEFRELKKKGGKKEAKPKKNEKTKKGKVKDENSGKTNKKSADKENATEETEPNIVITEEEVKYDYLDLYPAEMVYWRDMEPYYIKTKFTCVIDYEDIAKNRENIHLEAVCKVVRPDFRTNLNLQRIDFGKCVVGTDSVKTILLQNIKFESITPKCGLLNPVGPFSIPYLRDINVPPEQTLNIPLKFAPSRTGKVTEYFEIRSNATALPLILSGEGVPPLVTILPENTIFRLETKKNRLAELQFAISNKSDGTVTLDFQQVFEIMNDVVENKSAEAKGPKGKKGGIKQDSKSSQKGKPEQIRDELTDLEKDAISNHSSPLIGDSHFWVNCENNRLFLEKEKNQLVTIYFGEPEMILQQKNRKKDGKKRDKSSDKSSKKSDTSKTKQQYITQYNIFIGKTFIKSLVFVCTSV